MNTCAAQGCDVLTRNRFCSVTCEQNTCAAGLCTNRALQMGVCSPAHLQAWTREQSVASIDRHDPRVASEHACRSCANDTYDKGNPPPRVALSWLGEVYRPTIAGWVAADGTRVCCDQAALVHPYPCPWHVPWGGWPKPAGSVTPDHYAPIGVAS